MNAPSKDGLDSAWRIHSALSDWVSRVDSKATFALSLESAALVAITSIGHGTRHAAIGTSLWCGALLLTTALVFALAAVVPRTGPHRPADDLRHNLVYFGHLRHWDADELAEALVEQELLEGLSRQLITLSRIAWVKHRQVRASLILAGIGIALTAVPIMMEYAPGTN